MASWGRGAVLLLILYEWLQSHYSLLIHCQYEKNDKRSQMGFTQLNEIDSILTLIHQILETVLPHLNMEVILAVQ